MKKVQFQKHVITILSHLTKEIMVLIYQSTFLVHFTMLRATCSQNLDFWGING